MREPLETQTIQPKKYLKLINELGYNGHMLPILINFKVIHHTLGYREIILSMIILIHITYSPTYLQHLQRFTLDVWTWIRYFILPILEETILNVTKFSQVLYEWKFPC